MRHVPRGQSMRGAATAARFRTVSHHHSTPDTLSAPRCTRHFCPVEKISSPQVLELRGFTPVEKSHPWSEALKDDAFSPGEAQRWNLCTVDKFRGSILIK